MLQNFVWKCIDDRPDNILEYAGTYFDRAELHDVVRKAADKQKEAEPQFKYLNDLIKGKTLIEWWTINNLINERIILGWEPIRGERKR